MFDWISEWHDNCHVTVGVLVNSFISEHETASRLCWNYFRCQLRESYLQTCDLWTSSVILLESPNGRTLSFFRNANICSIFANGLSFVENPSRCTISIFGLQFGCICIVFLFLGFTFSTCNKYRRLFLHNNWRIAMKWIYTQWPFNFANAIDVDTTLISIEYSHWWLERFLLSVV